MNTYWLILNVFNFSCGLSLARGAALGAAPAWSQAGLGHAGADRSPQLPNERWSFDFLSDQLVDGRRFRILVVVDDCTRERLLLVADTSLSGAQVARELDWLIAARGKPKMIVSDNGTELTSTAILGFANDQTRYAGAFA